MTPDASQPPPPNPAARVLEYSGPRPAAPAITIAITGAPILDYASPASRSQLRLPARSELHVKREPGELRIHETLAGQAGAVFALLFAAFTIFCLLAAAYAEASGAKWRNHIGSISIYLAVAIAEFATMLAVIDSTWRTTTLTVGRDEILLRFRSPLRGSKLHRWPAEKLRLAFVRQTRLRGTGPQLAELELDLWGEAGVHLFVGHRPLELQDLADSIHQLHPLPQIPAPPPAPQ